MRAYYTYTTTTVIHIHVNIWGGIVTNNRIMFCTPCRRRRQPNVDESCQSSSFHPLLLVWFVCAGDVMLKGATRSSSIHSEDTYPLCTVCVCVFFSTLVFCIRRPMGTQRQGGTNEFSLRLSIRKSIYCFTVKPQGLLSKTKSICSDNSVTWYTLSSHNAAIDRVRDRSCPPRFA